MAERYKEHIWNLWGINLEGILQHTNYLKDQLVENFFCKSGKFFHYSMLNIQ